MIGRNLLKGSSGCYVCYRHKESFRQCATPGNVGSLDVPFILHRWLTIYIQGYNMLSSVVPSPRGSQLSQVFLRALSWGHCSFCPAFMTWPLSLSLMVHGCCYLLMTLCFINSYLTTRTLMISRQMWIAWRTGLNLII